MIFWNTPSTWSVDLSRLAFNRDAMRQKAVEDGFLPYLRQTLDQPGMFGNGQNTVSRVQSWKTAAHSVSSGQFVLAHK